MNTASPTHFDRQYQTHLKHLKLKGLQPKTIDAYARAIRRLGGYFSGQIDELSEAQLTEYFSDLIGTHSWSAVKLDLYGLKFYTTHVLKKPWVMPDLIKPPKTQRLPDIVTVDEAQRLFAATRTLSYRVFYFTLYSLGLRLGEGLALTVSDIDAARARVHIRDAKGNRDRFVPLPAATLTALRQFWHLYRGVLQEKDILSCENGQVRFRYRDSQTGRSAVRTVSGASFLFLILQHVLPKGFRRARNFGFLHPNSKRLIALLQVLLKVMPGARPTWMKPRPPFLCTCCGAPMRIVRRRIPSPAAHRLRSEGLSETAAM